MSRIGRIPIPLPPKVNVKVDGRHVVVDGPKGKLEMNLPARTSAAVAEGILTVSRDGDDSEAKALHGLTRALLYNCVKGVTEGYLIKLEIQGVGFKANVQGKQITMLLGYSHPIVYSIPDGVKVTVEDNTKIVVEGVDKQAVGLVASELRSFYPPEPYKGKGVRYQGEKVVRKEGKTVQQ